MDIVNDVVIFDYDMLLGLVFGSVYEIDCGDNDRIIITDTDLDKYCHILSKQYIKKERKTMGINYGSYNPVTGIDSDIFERVVLENGQKGYALNENDLRFISLIDHIDALTSRYSDIINEASRIFNVYYKCSMDSCDRRIRTNNGLMRILRKMGEIKY